MSIRLANVSDARRLNSALRALSTDLGDTHLATDELLRELGNGPNPAYHAVVSEPLRSADFDGVAVFSSYLSTTYGKAGIRISDLWVESAQRGSGLGRRLIRSAVLEARQLFGCHFVHLSVYRDNTDALRFYQRNGFVADSRSCYLSLSGDALGRLVDDTTG